MKNLFATLLAAVFVFTGTAMFAPDAEARRLGGGGSFGMKRNVTPAPTQSAAKPAQPAAAPATTPATSPAAAAGKRNWLGPIAGLAAGLGIAALLSHFGLGEGMANIIMIALLVLAAVVVFKLLFRRREQNPAAAGMQYAAAGAPGMTPADSGRVDASHFTAGGAGKVGVGDTPIAGIPADFDVESFLRQAKLNYIRLQAANDRGDMDDIRNFTAPEMFAEIQMQFDERGRTQQETDVQQLDATVLDVTEEDSRYIVSVRFFGHIREEAGGAVHAFDEVWHLTKPVSGGGWVIAGIQQFQ